MINISTGPLSLQVQVHFLWPARCSRNRSELFLVSFTLIHCTLGRILPFDKSLSEDSLSSVTQIAVYIGKILKIFQKIADSLSVSTRKILRPKFSGSASTNSKSIKIRTLTLELCGRSIRIVRRSSRSVSWEKWESPLLSSIAGCAGSLRCLESATEFGKLR